MSPLMIFFNKSFHVLLNFVLTAAHVMSQHMYGLITGWYVGTIALIYCRKFFYTCIINYRKSAWLPNMCQAVYKSTLYHIWCKKYAKTTVYMLTLILHHGNLIESLQFLFWQSNLFMPYWHREKNFHQAHATTQLEPFYSLGKYLFKASNNSSGLFTTYLSLNFMQLLTYCWLISVLCLVSIL